MNEKKKSGKKLSGSTIWILVAVVIGLITGLSDSDLDSDSILAVVVGLIVVAVPSLLLGALGKRKASSERPARRAARADARESTQSAARRPDPREKSFSAPDPYCVVCDHTGEDHFARDKAQRLAQLDDWLKNGLIDKAEYRALKEKYEKS